jgi:hypothetical protein
LLHRAVARRRFIFTAKEEDIENTRAHRETLTAVLSAAVRQSEPTFDTPKRSLFLPLFKLVTSLRFIPRRRYMSECSREKKAPPAYHPPRLHARAPTSKPPR